MAVTVNGKTYDTVKEALFEATGGATIKLDSDMTEDVIVYSRMNISLDLAGHKLTNIADHTIKVISGAMLRVFDSVGGGIVDCITHACGAVVNMNGGLCVLEGGKFTRSKEDSTGGSNTWYVIMNQGTMTITGTAEVEGTSSYSSAVRNGFDEHCALTASLTVSGGTISSNKIAVKVDGSGECTVSGGTIKCSDRAILNWCQATVSGGTVESTQYEPVLMASAGGVTATMNVTGGTFKAPAGFQPFAVSSESQEPTKAVVSGGSFTTAPDAQYLAPGFTVRTGSDGVPIVEGNEWDVIGGGQVGSGFHGFRRLILRKPVLDYIAGGVEIDVTDVVALVSVSAKGGLMGYYDTETNKVLLYRGTKEATGTLEDVSIVLLCE